MTDMPDAQMLINEDCLGWNSRI